MAREHTNPKDPNWKRWHCFATHTTESIHVYTWTCPDCGTINNTRVNTEADTRRFSFGIEARCGHCHGNSRRLTDKAGWTFDPTIPGITP